MLNGKRVLAIIPARAGSKRVKGKNLKSIYGKPLISWTLEAAKASKYIDSIAVSTDSDEIIAVAKGYGINVPYKRPDELATDTASSADVIIYELNKRIEIEALAYDYFVLLQPTSPLRTAADIDAALEELDIKSALSVVSVCPVEHSPLWSNTLPDDLSMNNFISADVKGKRSQDLPQYYRLNGAIYICNTQRFLKEKSFLFSERTFAYIMSQESSVDIDTELDFAVAEVLLKNTRV